MTKKQKPMIKSPASAPREKIADASAELRHVFVRDLVLDASVGIYEFEKVDAQPIIVNIDLAVSEGAGASGRGEGDDIANTVSYEDAVNTVKAILAEGHVNLVESLAEEIARRIFEDARVVHARVRVEKPDIIPEAASVGIEIHRQNPNH